MEKSVIRRNDIDRGWAWVVMTSSFIGMVIYCVPLYMSGVLYIALLDKYNKGEAETSLIGAINAGLLCFAAPIGGIINNRFSCRVSIVFGGALTTIGFATSAFVPSLGWMVVTAGVFIGFGFAISSSGLICVVGFYFEKWRDTVISCAFLVVGPAMFISAPFGLHLVTNYGLTGAFLILACIQAQMCVCGMLSKPSDIEKEVQAQKKRDRQVEGGSKSKTYLDVTLMKNISYTFYLLTVSTWNFGLSVAIMHLPNYISILGGSNRDIGLLMTSFSVANTIGRLLGSLTVSKMRDKDLLVYVGVLGLTGIFTSLFILYSDFTGGAYIFAIQLGIFTGWPNSMMTPLSLRFVGVHKISEAYGLAYVFSGLGVTTGPVLIGYLYTVTRSYEYSFVVAGVVLCLGCILGICSLCCRRYSRTDDRTTELIVISKENLDNQKSLLFSDDSSLEQKLTDSGKQCDSTEWNTHIDNVNLNGTCAKQHDFAEELDELLHDDIR